MQRHGSHWGPVERPACPVRCAAAVSSVGLPHAARAVAHVWCRAPSGLCQCSRQLCSFLSTMHQVSGLCRCMRRTGRLAGCVAAARSIRGLLAVWRLCEQQVAINDRLAGPQASTANALGHVPQGNEIKTWHMAGTAFTSPAPLSFPLQFSSEHCCSMRTVPASPTVRVWRGVRSGAYS